MKPLSKIISTVPPKSAVILPPAPSGNEKKMNVMKVVKEGPLMTWRTPPIVRCLLAISEKIPGSESAIGLYMENLNATPQKPLSNHAIAAKLFQDTVSQLEDDSDMITYLFKLISQKMDPSTPSFSLLHSMVWAGLVTWMAQVKTALEPSRKVSKSQSSSGNTPLKVETGAPAELMAGILEISKVKPLDAMDSIGVNYAKGELSVETKSPNFMWRKAT
ncbi:hypothetical protein HDU80_011710 [Chytriomyces hyalinus]|nr:hypothetical protein HDU80_011710 [Chytriomyces hyalinus]